MGEASTTVAAPAERVIAFVLDLRRYRQADRKIGRVGEVRRTGQSGTMQFSGRIRGLPGPSGTYPFTVTDTGIAVGAPLSGPVRWFLSDFEGRFDTRETDAGTVVTHRESFAFKRPWDWLAHHFLRHWLETDVEAEMVRLKSLVEADPARSLPRERLE